MIPGYDSTKRYKVSGYLDTESRVLYFDMTEAEVAIFRASDKAIRTVAPMAAGLRVWLFYAEKDHTAGN